MEELIGRATSYVMKELWDGPWDPKDPTIISRDISWVIPYISMGSDIKYGGICSTAQKPWDVPCDPNNPMGHRMIYTTGVHGIPHRIHYPIGYVCRRVLHWTSHGCQYNPGIPIRARSNENLSMILHQFFLFDLICI